MNFIHFNGFSFGFGKTDEEVDTFSNFILIEFWVNEVPT